MLSDASSTFFCPENGCSGIDKGVGMGLANEVWILHSPCLCRCTVDVDVDVAMMDLGVVRRSRDRSG